MEITNEFRIAAFMAYYGCEYQYRFAKNYPLFTAKVGNAQYQTIHSLLEDVKLILTPLEDITDEHALELSNIYGHTEPSEYLGHGLILACFTDYEVDNEITLLDGIKVGDFLRFKGYNIPFRGVNLVEAGIAILKQKEGENE